MYIPKYDICVIIVLMAKGCEIMKYRKETNGFETSIFGIDLFIKWIIDRIKNRRKNTKVK